MFDKIKSLFATAPKADLSELARQGAIILDVRSSREFAGGHISGSLNIPVETLSRSLGKLKDKNRPIITCCASGSRSRIAANILKAQGYVTVHNGGGWHSLRSKIGK